MGKEPMTLEEWRQRTKQGIDNMPNDIPTLEVALRNMQECIRQLKCKKGPYYNKCKRGMRLANNKVYKNKRPKH